MTVLLPCTAYMQEKVNETVAVCSLKGELLIIIPWGPAIQDKEIILLTKP